MMKYKIGVVGSAHGEVDPEISEKAREIGRAVARYDCILLTGSNIGLTYEAVKGAKENNGFTIGFSPYSNRSEHLEHKYPVDYFDILIFTGMGVRGRCIPFVNSCDGLIGIAGGVGTLNELTIALYERKPIGILKGSGGISENIQKILDVSGKISGKVLYSYDSKLLVKELKGSL